MPGLVVDEDYELAHRIFSAKILAEYVDDDYQTAHWGEDPYNYHDQNTAKFATAVMDGSMSNLWEGESVIEWEDKVTELGFSETTQGRIEVQGTFPIRGQESRQTRK